CVPRPTAPVASPPRPSPPLRRAARRPPAERRSPSSLWPSINAFKRSRVRSDAGILPIGVLLRQRSVAKPDLVDSPIRRRCTPTLFPAILGLHRHSFAIDPVKPNVHGVRLLVQHLQMLPSAVR